jgi:hypothetical protein
MYNFKISVDILPFMDILCNIYHLPKDICNLIIHWYWVIHAFDYLYDHTNVYINNFIFNKLNLQYLFISTTVSLKFMFVGRDICLFNDIIIYFYFFI